MADMTVAVALVGEDRASGPIGHVSVALKGLESAAAAPTRAIGGLGDILGKVGLAGMGISAVAGTVKALGGALVSPIQAASDLSESINKADVVFGDSAASIQAWAKTAAASMGQSRAEALGAAGGFGNLFVSMGLGQKPAADLSKRIVELGSDLASFNNIKPEEALEKLRAGLVGEAEPLRALGVNINAAAVEDEALRLGLAKTKDEITDAAKIQARYSLILKQTKTAQGDFARTSTGMANAQRIITASLADLQTQIGERLLPVVAPLVSSFAQALPRAMEAIAPILDRVGDELQVWAYAFGEGGIGGIIEQAVDDISSGRLFGALRDLGQGAVTALVEGFRAARDLAGRVGGWLGEQIARIDWGRVWSTVRGVAAGLLAGLGSIVSDVTSWLVAQWRSINWTAVWGAVTNIASGLVGALGSVVSDVTAWLVTQWKAIQWPQVWAAVTGIGSGLVSGAVSIAQSVTSWVSTQWQNIDWGSVWNSVKGVGETLVTGLVAVATEVTTWLGVQFGSVKWDEVWKAVQGHGEALVKSLAPITEDVQTWLVAQWAAIRWDEVFAAAGTAAEMTRSLEGEINKIEVGGPIGRALARALVGTMKFAVEAATGPGGGFDGAGLLMVAAWLREVAMFPFFVLGWVRREFMEAVKQGLAEGVEQLNLAQFTTDLKNKVLGAIRAIFPIKAGPVTLSLSGVSIEPVVVRTPFQPTPPPLGGTGETIPGFQRGGVFRVGGRGGPDSQLVAFRATPGEVVAVGHGRSEPGGYGAVSVTINLGGVSVSGQGDEERFVARMRDELESFFTDGLRAARTSGTRFPLGVRGPAGA
jgi:hypothetical protein